MTEKQLKDELRKEQAFNALFDTIAQKSPFGQWYGLMLAASNAYTKNLAQRVCLDKNNRPIIIYKTEFGKITGIFATATHKFVAEDLAQKKYGKALLDLLTGGQGSRIVEQNKKYTQCFDISPKEVTEMYAKKQAAKNPAIKSQINTAIKNDKNIKAKTFFQWLSEILT